MEFIQGFYDQNELKHTFIQLLSKLSLPETKDNAIKEIYKLIKTNNNVKNIRIWLSSLYDYKRPTNKVNNEYEILLIGFLASIYKTAFIDPIDKPPHITKTILKLISLLQNYFKDESEKIHIACSKTWREIYINCLLNQNLQIRNLLMFETLFGIINGGADRLSQQTCLIILKDFVECLGKINDQEFLQVISEKIYPLFIKNSFDTPSILQIICLLIIFQNNETFFSFEKEIIEKTLFYLNNTKVPWSSYIFKIEACNLLKNIAIKSLETNEYRIGVFHNKIIKILMEITKDRVAKVQNAAKEALSYWIKQMKNYEKQEAAKTSKAFENMNIDEVINLRSSNEFYQKYNQMIGDENKSNELNKQKNNKEFLNNQDELNYGEIFQKGAGWISETKGKQFIKKKTGTGGGFVILEQEKSKKPFVKTSNENLKKELNEILQRSYEKSTSSNNNNALTSNDNKFDISFNENNEELDNTIKYDSDESLDQTMDFNEINDENHKENLQRANEKEEEISQMWFDTLKLLENNEIDKAYDLVLSSGDDIYLLRLMMKTGSCIKKLRRKTAVLLLKRLTQIGKSNFLQKICFNFLDDFKNKKAKDALNIEEQHKILNILEKMEKKKGPLLEKTQKLRDFYAKSFK